MDKAFWGSFGVAALSWGYLLAKSNALRVYSYEITSPKLPDEFDGFRIVLLSDLHYKRYGQNDEELVHICRELEPDMIAFTGDLYSRDRALSGIFKRLPLMKGLVGIAPVYYIWGNHEGDTPVKSEIMSDRMAKLGVNVLRNRSVSFERGGSHIDIYGLELPPRFYRSAAGSYRSLPKVTRDVMYDCVGVPDRECFNLLLAHTPLPFRQYAEWGADLTLSGHIHGGIIRVCGIGLLSPERSFFPRYTKGLYRRGESKMVVSAGLGKMRINNPEMVALCVLKKQAAQT